jgi:hypothetical protein
MAKTGLLEYYALSEWWQSALTPTERDRVESVFSPLGSTGRRPLTQGSVGEIHGTTATAAGLLSSLIGWLRSTPEDLVIRRKMRDHLATLIASDTNVVSRHFALQVLIGEYYRDRAVDAAAKPAAIAACKAQIAVSREVAAAMRNDFPDRLPRHIGFEQLAIILEKDTNYAAAIDVCEEASAGGWNGDWTKRVERCRSRMAKTIPKHEGGQ